MGCDIHFYVERRVDGVWQAADTWVDDGYGDKGVPRLHVPYEAQYYSDRDYEFYGILAGVRRPQAGEPVAHRGVPEDACPEYKAHVERWDFDGHSHSHFTLAEFFEYDWTQEAKFEGWVHLNEWVRCRDNPEGPDAYCGGVGGATIRHHTMEQFEEAWQALCREKGWSPDSKPRWKIDPNDPLDPVKSRMIALLGGGDPYCHFRWSVPYYKSARRFWSDVIPRLLRLGKPEDVRCVFFFDN
ncbi:hypothetical protein CcrColossus_gp397 [Caulobacter phage CcrColossus]|uniref:Uncharacterized protein n=1 Tax=Caulobacter phage CcrColossus TaxID=1211640 RepID=K4K6Q7_9CAUD|nr:hypothetical protein CcrColossus_gp397 [Caulobacter phage CcrColossus]AFU88267.1 hypothetical protein CcrColossus_gp397 [Caulobacter phage CcrColossus]